jgi:hypothetical protein
MAQRTRKQSLLIAAALACIPFGLSGAWLYSLNQMEDNQIEDFRRRVRLVVRARLEQEGPDSANLTADSVLRDLMEVERAKRMKQ